MHVTRIAEQVGRAPEQLDAGPLLLLLEHLHHRIEVAIRLGEVRALGSHVAIVEGIERRPELLDELERDAGPLLGVFDGVRAVVPRPHRRARPERIGAHAAERVPIDDAEPQVVLHRLAGHLFVLVVVAEGERVLAFRAFERDAADFGKRGHGEFTFRCGGRNALRTPSSAEIELQRERHAKDSYFIDRNDSSGGGMLDRLVGYEYAEDGLPIGPTGRGGNSLGWNI